ncbi:hypothetical protein HDU96_001135 [Phlyctochytrium bullatum]|nr:hypothetical protein HDU96_001135 [Phlyctochytrium bullatum]
MTKRKLPSTSAPTTSTTDADGSPPRKRTASGPNSTLPRGVCVAVAHLRPTHTDLAHWLSDPRHLLVTRAGRVFITSPTGTRRVFAYPASPWANPFKLKEYSLDESLRRFEMHLREKVAEPRVRREFVEEVGRATEVGCFCRPTERCHRDVIIRVLKEVLEEDGRS